MTTNNKDHIRPKKILEIATIQSTLVNSSKMTSRDFSNHIQQLIREAEAIKNKGMTLNLNA